MCNRLSALECWTDASAQIFWLYKLLDILAKGRDFGGAHRMRLLESEVKRRWREEEKEASSLCVDDEADFPRAFCDTCGGELRRQPRKERLAKKTRFQSGKRVSEAVC